MSYIADPDAGATPAPQPTVQAPSVIPLNTASLLRWAITLLAGFLIDHGYATSSTAVEYAGGIVALAVAIWHVYKNQNVVKNIVGALQAPAQLVVHPLTGAAIAPRLAAVLLAVALVAPGMLALSACAAAPISGPQAQLDSVKVVYGFEKTYNTVSLLYLQWAPGKSDAQKAEPKALLAKAYAATQAAEAAAAAGRAADEQAQIAALGDLARQVAALISGPAAAPTR